MTIRPLLSLNSVMGDLAQDDFTVKVDFADRGDEIGAIARAVQADLTTWIDIDFQGR